MTVQIGATLLDADRPVISILPTYTIIASIDDRGTIIRPPAYLHVPDDQVTDVVQQIRALASRGSTIDIRINADV